VRVLTGNSLTQLTGKIQADFDTDPRLFKKPPPYEYYPKEEFDPWFARRSAVAEQLYSSLNIGRRDVAGRRAQIKRNLNFFDAPVGMIFSIDRRMEKGSWLDYGAFLQNIMLLAVENDLSTCPMGIFILYENLIAEHCAFDENETIMCAMALGYQKTYAPENQFITPRSTDFYTFMD
jgi:nitroreductase